MLLDEIFNFFRNMSLFSWDLLGYMGSIFVVTGIMQTKIKRLRMFAATGAFILAIYGLMIKAYPVFLLNVLSSGFSSFYLLRMNLQKDYFLLNDTLKGGEFFLENFLRFYQDEILKFFPDFDLSQIKNPNIYVISRKMNPVGLFIYEDIGNGIFQVHLDFATPEYRDFKNFLFILESKRDHWLASGHHTMLVRTKVLEHEKYLLKMGFKLVHAGSREFHKDIRSHA